MKALMSVCLGVLLFCAAQTQAQLNREESVYLRFNPDATNWVEGTITEMSADGHFRLFGSDSPYAANYADFHRQFYAIDNSQRELKRKELRERFRDRLRYNWRNEYAQGFSVMIPSDKFSVFDESSRYGLAFDTWNYTEETRLYHCGAVRVDERSDAGVANHYNV